MPTKQPTDYPSEPLCAGLIVHTGCDPVYPDLDGVYHAAAHRGGKTCFITPTMATVYSIIMMTEVTGQLRMSKTQNSSTR